MNVNPGYDVYYTSFIFRIDFFVVTRLLINGTLQVVNITIPNRWSSSPHSHSFWRNLTTHYSWFIKRREGRSNRVFLSETLSLITSQITRPPPINSYFYYSCGSSLSVLSLLFLCPKSSPLTLIPTSKLPSCVGKWGHLSSPSRLLLHS